MVVLGRVGAYLDAAVGVLDPHLVVAEHHDVFHARVFGDGLQPAQSEQVRQDGVQQPLFVLVADAVAGLAAGVDPGADHLGADVLADRPAVLGADLGRLSELGG